MCLATAPTLFTDYLGPRIHLAAMDDKNELKAPHKQLIEQMVVHYDLPCSRTPPISFDYKKIVSPKTPPETETPFPEGGLRAWSVVAGVSEFCTTL